MSLVYIFTGSGKGKTTAAFGTALRALSKGKSVAIVQFFKNQDWFGIGETDFLAKSTNLVEIYQYGKKGWVNPKHPTQEDILNAKKGLDKCLRLIKDKKVFLLIADELLIGVLFKIIKSKEVVDLIKLAKANDVNLIITGRGSTKSINNAADLVSEMNLIKHHYDKGQVAIEGLEY
ncbi:cob(I)yrinic acid a,c-diamide adenosyltransferase [Candidatus Dojkabacteria bacterium]|uniref:Cob(I)yrinic acid a,c-diamide adenosyltransferase n=1 Tax=Candidatus Dojkabacteria bacterium TaxID=2099670 RepID=A0A955L394_9BACT|nr:cob(I)yrinic acid a,c-diamide adenosyltransferase [Candidatus Dojkabacteria bacterium]